GSTFTVYNENHVPTATATVSNDGSFVVTPTANGRGYIEYELLQDGTRILSVVGIFIYPGNRPTARTTTITTTTLPLVRAAVAVQDVFQVAVGARVRGKILAQH